jgi:hypothetical protein
VRIRSRSAWSRSRLCEESLHAFTKSNGWPEPPTAARFRPWAASPSGSARRPRDSERARLSARYSSLIPVKPRGSSSRTNVHPPGRETSSPSACATTSPQPAHGVARNNLAIRTVVSEATATGLMPPVHMLQWCCRSCFPVCSPPGRGPRPQNRAAYAVSRPQGLT